MAVDLYSIELDNGFSESISPVFALNLELMGLESTSFCRVVDAMFRNIVLFVSIDGEVVACCSRSA